ncbi:MAG: hypothetical protein ACK42F_03150, partial [Sphingobacteriales bacterium]
MKLFVTVLVLAFFWVIPLESNGFLRTPVQDALVTDANYYDYAALEIATQGLTNSGELIFSTWLSFGVIGYIYLIYSIFGVSILYVALVNCLLILAAALCIKYAIIKLYPASE